MRTRRNFFIQLGAVGSAVAIAGCSGGSSESEPETNGTDDSNETDDSNDTDDGDEPEFESPRDPAEVLPGIDVGEIRLDYGFSSGLRMRLEMSDPDESDEDRVYVEIEAFAGEESMGTDSDWDTVAGSTEYDLTIESIGSLGEYDLDDLTRFVVRARFDGEPVEPIASFTGDEVREQVDA